MSHSLIIPNLFCNSDFAAEDGHGQLCVDIQFAKKAVPMHGFEGPTVPLCKY